MPQNIVFFLYDGFQLLDYSGVAAVFEMANRYSDETLYEVNAIALSNNMVSASNGLNVQVNDTAQTLAANIDLAIVIGGESVSLRKAISNNSQLSLVKSLCGRAKRICSICSGTFFLAAIGELKGRRATTHWLALDELAKRYPAINVCDHVLYTMDEHVYTSAGVATGIDLALEIVSRDHGIALSNKVAKRLVVNMHRPASTPQTSSLLHEQLDQGGRFNALCTWLANNLDKDIQVQDMANYVAMSPRNFSRQFIQTKGLSPHQFFIQLKLAHAKLMLNRGYRIDQICKATGYKSELGLNNAFEKSEGMSLFQYKTLRNVASHTSHI